MSAEIVHLAARRRQFVGWRIYICGICGYHVHTMVSDDHFPSCRQCRFLCETERDIREASGQ